MATPSRPADPVVDSAELMLMLEDSPQRFEFFQAVRLLERLWRRRPVGRWDKPQEEAARFGAHASLAFPASQIQSLERRPDRPPQMVVNFMGLFGPMGVLPHYYTEKVAERLRERDTTLRDFLDVFNHRMISLFYQAWEKYRFTISYERGEREGLSHYLLDLIGLGTHGLQERQPVSDDSLRFYAGLLAQHPRSAAGLKQILMDYFEVPVEVEQFAGCWYKLSPDTQCTISEQNRESEKLGVGVVVGDEVWDQQSRVRLRLGPLTMERYRDFLPNGTAFEPLRALCRFIGGDEIDFEVQLVLKRDEVPPCELGAAEEAAPLLGWASWMKWAPFSRDPGDALLLL